MSGLQDLVVRLRDSASGSSTMVVVILGVLVIVAIVVGAGFYIAHLLSPRGRLDMLLGERSASGKRNPWPARLIVLSILVIAFVSLNTYVRSSQTCASCHQEAQYAKTLKSTIHAKAACMDCHGGTGLMSSASDTLMFGRWAWDYYVANAQPKVTLQVDVSSANCARCHESILEGTKVVDGLRVRHKDFIDAGTPCTGCHDDVSHTVPGKEQTSPTMNSCLPCHDGKRASSKCATCHTQDIGASAVAKNKQSMAVVAIAGSYDFCYRCHQERNCTSCHGVRMPHPPGWAPTGIQTGLIQPGSGVDPGTHARAGFQNRQYCWRCHHVDGQPFKPSDASCRCHGLLGSMHGGAAWVKEHGLEATGQKPGAVNQCGACHGNPSVFCGFCHPPSYAKRYAPQPPTNDQYKRDEPQNAADFYWLDGSTGP